MLKTNPAPLSTVILGFDGPSLPQSVASLLSMGLGGVALFKRNIEDPPQVRELCASVREACGRDWPPPVIAIDQEGGRVQRLRGLVSDMPSMAEVGKRGAGAVFEAGLETGRQVSALGFNVDFAPVLDVNTNKANPIIGDRAFAADADVCARHGVEFMEGLHEAGVAACGKHFPGHGDTRADSHLELPVVEAGIDTLLNRELKPFELAAARGIRMLMTAHCLYPAVDPDLPATLSRRIIDGLLRRRIGFEGVVITDDLGMKAVSERFSFQEILGFGFEAGVDLFMHCGAKGEGEELAHTLLSMLDGGDLDDSVVEASARRVMVLRTGL
ncbi:MAG: beta-N-acetylhexosaminidase [Deltaproteobacteria bacterium]|nr:beta-N-acetylhexosaminidase [Deltaproteobacteria bacterium]